MPFGDGHLRLGDHDRLREKHIRWEPGWNLSRFIELLNGLVFFWPGTPDGPSDAGLDHKRRYDNEGQPMVVLRASLVDLVAINGFPLVSACNSGAPRSNPRSGKQPRGADTFRSIDSLGAGERVVEVVFENQVVLPDSTERADSYGTGWRGLLAALS